MIKFHSNKTAFRIGIKHLAAVFITVLFSGCLLGPDYSRPALEMPGQFSEAVPAGETVANLEWWSFYQDPILVGLVRKTLAENRDLQAATARIDQARAILGYVHSDQFPKVDLGAEAGRTDLSDQILNSNSAPANLFGVLGSLSFEVDIWGRLRRATEAERAQLLATEYASRAITITLVSQTATTYMTILGLDDRIEIAKKTIKNRKDATGIIRARFDKGVVPELDVNQAEIEQADAVLTMIALERQRKQAENALTVLVGGQRVSIPRNSTFIQQSLPTNIPAGVPAALLERRPDVLAAEAQVKSATARIGVAEAEQWPALDLSGFIGLQSDDFGDLFSHDAFTWKYAGNLIGPLIDFGKSRYNVEASEAFALEMLKVYEQTILQAVQEVEDALVAIRTFQDEYGQRLAQIKSAQNASRLSWARYNDGVTTYLEVLDVDRSLFQAQLGGSQSRENYLNSVARLYKALGGGWKMETVDSNPPAVSLR